MVSASVRRHTLAGLVIGLTIVTVPAASAIRDTPPQAWASRPSMRR